MVSKHTLTLNIVPPLIGYHMSQSQRIQCTEYTGPKPHPNNKCHTLFVCIDTIGGSPTFRSIMIKFVIGHVYNRLCFISLHLHDRCFDWRKCATAIQLPL